MFDGDIKAFFAISGNFLSNVPDTVYRSHAMQPLHAHSSCLYKAEPLSLGHRRAAESGAGPAALRFDSIFA